MDKIIYGRIVKIIDDTQIIIDKGEINGVHVGMKFVIYDEGDVVTDPTTGRVLDKLEIQKGIVIVKQTMPGLSLLETREEIVKKENPISQYVKTIADYYQPYTFERIKERLVIDPHSLSAILFKKRPVNLGDKVRSIIL